MVKDAYTFLVPLLATSLLSYVAGFAVLTGVLVVLAAFVAYFFRDPERAIPDDPRAIVSPADGKVIGVKSSGKTRVLSIFLSIFDVHVNRAPVGGLIERQEHRPGRYRVAYDDRASVENERLIITIAGPRKLTFSLVAGVIARRILPWKKPGQTVHKGDRIGLIRFGSRVDVEIPPECELVVQEGDHVQGGSSTIAYWKEDIER